MSAARARHRARSLFAISLAAVTLLTALLSSSAGASGLGGQVSSPVLPNAPLAASLGTTEGTWVDVAMGDLGELANTFWELVIERPGSSRFSLATPPGFADNGGLVGVSSGSSYLAGFRASQLIAFSPLALSSDGGGHWSAAVLNRALASSPDALAASGHGSVAALVGDPAAVLSSAGDLSSWRSVVTEKRLAAAAAAKDCGLRAITAVAYAPSGQLLVGASCSRSAGAGIFEASSAGWRLVAPALPSAGASAPSSVVRLRDFQGGVEALIADESGGRLELLGSRLAGSGGWSPPLALALAPGARLISTGVASDGALLVLASAKGHLAADALLPGARAWKALPAPPPATTAIAFEPDGALDAMTVDHSQLTIYRRDPPGSGWLRVQVLQVPIEYGSSS